MKTSSLWSGRVLAITFDKSGVQFSTFNLFMALGCLFTRCHIRNLSSATQSSGRSNQQIFPIVQRCSFIAAPYNVQPLQSKGHKAPRDATVAWWFINCLRFSTLGSNSCWGPEESNTALTKIFHHLWISDSDDLSSCVKSAAAAPCLSWEKVATIFWSDEHDSFRMQSSPLTKKEPLFR